MRPQRGLWERDEDEERFHNVQLINMKSPIEQNLIPVPNQVGQGQE